MTTSSLDGSVRQAWPGGEVALPGGPLHVRRAVRRGAPVAVYVHGLGGASTNWTDLMWLLADEVDGHAPDLPGFGWSPPPRSGRYSIGTHVRAVVEYIEHLGGGPVHLLGNSMGGAISIRLAAERPDLVETLALIAPALPQYRLRRTTDPRLGLMLIPGVAGLTMRRSARRPAEQRVDDVLALCLVDQSTMPAQRRADLVAEYARRAELGWADDALMRSMRGLAATYVDPGERNLWRAAAKVTAPTLLVFGRGDRLVPVDIAERARRTFRDSRLLVLDDVGHIPQVEAPDVVAAEIRKLWRGARRAPQ